MSKDATDFSNAPMPEETPATQTSLDLFNSFLNAPVTKLDADEYLALDQDGVTEGVTGSGNMNFLMMQAGQTNESMANANPFDLANRDEAMTGASNLFSPNAGVSAFGGAGGAGGDTNTDRSFERPDDFRGLGDGGASTHNNDMTGTLSASNLAANTQSATSFSDASSYASSSATSDSISSTQTATNGNNGTGQDGVAGTPGAPGAPGTPGEGGGGTTIINNIIDDTTHLGDSITNLIDNTVHNTTDLISTIVNDTTSIVNNTVNNVTDIINNLLGGDHHPIGLDLNATLDDLTHLNLDILGNGDVFHVINEAIDLSPILTPVTDILGDVVSDLNLHVLLDPLHYDSSPTDTDLHVGTGLDILGLGIPDLNINIPLDPVEALVGDIDLNLDISQTLADLLPPVGGSADHDLGLGGLNNALDLTPVTDGLSAIINPVEGLVGDLDVGGNIGLGFLGTDIDAAGAPDTDITIPLDIGLIDNPLLNDGLHINLDPVEALTGDIDLNLGAAVNLLGDTAAPIFDALAGGSGTNDIVSQVGNTVSHIADSFLPTDSATGDNDLTIGTDLGLLDTHLLDNITDVSLDHVEAITGDIDIGSHLDLGLLGSSTTDVAGANDLNIGLGDLGLGNIGLNLDPVEAITGNIDLGLNISSDLTGNLATDPGAAVGGLLGNLLDTIDHTVDTAVGLLDNTPLATGGLDLGALTGGDANSAASNLPSWTESVLPDAGNVLGGGLIDTVSHIPDVLSSPAVSLPAAIAPVVTTVLGGLLGGGSHHHGGLFG